MYLWWNEFYRIMNIRKYVFSAIVFFTAFVGCKKDNYNHIAFQQPHFKDSVDVKARILNDTIYVKYIFEIAGYKDNLILFTPGENSMFQLYDKTGKKLKEFGSLGRGYQEIFNVGDFSINPRLGTLTSFHQASRDVYLFYLDSVIQNKEVFMQKINLSKFEDMTFFNAYKCDEGFLLTGSKCEEYPGGARFSLFSDQGNFICAYDQYPINSRKSNDNTNNDLDWSMLKVKQAVSPRGDKIAEMTEVGGILEVIDVQNGMKQKILRGYVKPHFFQKDYKLTFTKKTRFWARKLYASENYLYMLPSDGFYAMTLSRDILVFDWSGNPVKKYKTDQNLVSIYPDEDNGKLYAISYSESREYMLVSFDL